MNFETAYLKFTAVCDEHGIDEAFKRLEGVTGPERHLVGESRSDGPTSDVEAAEPGRRGVGKIVDATKLLRTIDYKLKKARRGEAAAIRNSRIRKEAFHAGKVAALTEVRDIVENRAEERSDLPNSELSNP